MKLVNFPEEIVELCGLKNKATDDGYVYAEVRKRDVWPASSGHSSTETFREAPQYGRLLPKQNNPRFLDAHVATYLLYSCGG